jgi:GH25 family lysozyme M1 (1,4-beta-N-acetylmuramidase)
MSKPHSSLLRLVLAAAALALLVFGAGAAMPGSARADDDDDGGHGGHDVNYCNPGMKSTTTVNGVVVQTCTITAASGTCHQRSSAPLVSQRCTFTQTGDQKEKRALATQIHDPEGLQGEQDAEQVIKVEQSGSSRRNLLDATQIADQCLGAGDRHEDDDDDWGDDDRDGDRDDDGRCEDEDEEDGDDEEESEDRFALSLLSPLSSVSSVTQDQDAHQTIDGNQTATGSGKNEAKSFQSQQLHQRAVGGTVINQLQNIEDEEDECNEALVFGFTNACFTVVQTSGSGPNLSKLSQDYNLFQSARNATSGRQEQGSADFSAGGLNHGFDQNAVSGGKPLQVSDQEERLTQRRHNAPLIWHQHGPVRKDFGEQFGNDDALAFMDQDSVLSSIGPGVGEQTDVLTIECSSSGLCSGLQRAETNDDEARNPPSGRFTLPAIFMSIICNNPESEYTEVGDCVATAEPGGGD